MNTETLDKLYLEWSQFTHARTSREIEMAQALSKLVAILDSRHGSVSDKMGSLAYLVDTEVRGILGRVPYKCES